MHDGFHDKKVLSDHIKFHITTQYFLSEHRNMNINYFAFLSINEKVYKFEFNNGIVFPNNSFKSNHQQAHNCKKSANSDVREPMTKDTMIKNNADKK